MKPGPLRLGIFAIVAGGLFTGGAAEADSPLTSIDFADAYAELPTVVAARDNAGKSAVLDAAVLRALLSAATPNDEKAAMVSALGWGQSHTRAFLEGVAAGRDAERLQLSELDAGQRFVAGYMLALDDYLELKPLEPDGAGLWRLSPQALLDSAAQALPRDFTVQLVRAMVRAQAAMASFCQVFRITSAVLTEFSVAQRNLRPRAVKAAVDYLASYGDDCPGSAASSKKRVSELNQIYGLARLGAQVVAGTQAGVVVWDPSREEPVAVHDEVICRVLAWRDGVWAGCDKSLVHWDGSTFRVYLENAADDAEYFLPMRGPFGALWVRYGKTTVAYDAARDRFDAIQAPWPGAPYDALFTQNGEACWIDFMRSFTCGKRTFPLKSASYPGRDPRRLREDAVGTLWVEDFDDGLFRLVPGTGPRAAPAAGANKSEPDRDTPSWSERAGRFVAEPALKKKAAGVAFDVHRQRLWLLHYTDGVWLSANGRVDAIGTLKSLAYMRDLLLDDDGTLWVAGWTGLVRLRERQRPASQSDGPPAWEQRIYRVVR